MKNKFKFLAFAVLLIGSISACKKDEPLPDVNEDELITTVTLRFTNAANPSDVVTVTARDLDGDGGNAPVIGSIQLRPNATYNWEVTQILNETESPAEDIKEEIEEEDDEHLLVYTATPANLIAINITDKDRNNLPVGLAGTATTTAAGTGSLRVTLRHQPNGLKNGTATPGSTDFEFTFPLTVVNPS
ncbi:hypothetical protein [Pedobacter glucosidilyticus]|uniref:hypothetical protein n=1 Tax=Pedobacter glucosidilyticus TaxID=1122941 RepID=UPI0026E9C307|nr:hypothetical protein [Pedobacter glucosidilyticus]